MVIIYFEYLIYNEVIFKMLYRYQNIRFIRKQKLMGKG